MLPEFENARASLRQRGVIIDHCGPELIVRLDTDDKLKGERFDTWLEAVARGEELAATIERVVPPAPARRFRKPGTVKGWWKRHMRRQRYAMTRRRGAR